MAKKKNITIHKANEIVRGGDNLSVYGKRALNAIYYLIQMNVNKGNIRAIEQAEYIPLEFPYLRKMMNLEKVESYIKEIEKALTELQQPIQLNNFKNPRDGQIYNWYSISFISEASWKLDNNKKIAYVALSPLVKWLMINTNNGNFTKLELIDVVNKLRTKYAMKLYEYLKSFGGYKYIDISQKHLLKLLGLPEDHKTYKHYAKLKTVIERQLKEIANKTDLKEVKLLNYKSLAKEKIFRIIINPKASKKTAKPKEIEDVLNAMIKRF
jgi:hypothetical protein